MSPGQIFTVLYEPPLAVRPVQIRSNRVVMRPAACCGQLISFLLEHPAVACSPSTAARKPLSTLQTKLGDRRRRTCRRVTGRRDTV